MKSVVIAAHPNIEQSNIHRQIIAAFRKAEIDVYNLYEKYPDERIDVQLEQHVVEQADQIIFEFPFYWYSSPPLLKKWFDEVLLSGWAFGPGGHALKGKKVSVLTSTGGPKEAYSAIGYNQFAVEDLLLPLQAMANLTQMDYTSPMIIYGARTISQADLTYKINEFVAQIRT